MVLLNPHRGLAEALYDVIARNQTVRVCPYTAYYTIVWRIMCGIAHSERTLLVLYAAVNRHVLRCPRGKMFGTS